METLSMGNGSEKALGPLDLIPAVTGADGGLEHLGRRNGLIPRTVAEPLIVLVRFGGVVLANLLACK